MRPDYAESCNNLGVVLTHLGELERAVSCFEQALRQKPAYAEACNNQGVALAALGQRERATAAYQQAVRLKPDYAEAWNNLGILRHEDNDLATAADCYQRALRLKPNYAEASNNLATAWKEQGLLDEALAQYRETLRYRPDHALTLYNLSQFAAEGRCHFGLADLERIKSLIVSERVPVLDRSLLCYTLGSVLDRQNGADEAFGWFQRANDLRRRYHEDHNNAFDLQAHRTQVDRVIAAFDRTYFQGVQGWGLASEVPVFIVGMPRCGSSLVEQILASHTQVFGAGELGKLPQLIAASVRRACGTDLAAGSKPPRDRAAAQALAADCLARLKQLGGAASRVTVKTLENFMYLGTIAVLFPHARIIHCRRDPLDVGLSCFFQNFQGVSFTCTLEDIGAYYREYERLMAHWRQVLPLPVLEVGYEELVHDPDPAIRRMLAFCGLEWEDDCRDFFKTRRSVRTASTLQVRKPISTSSVGRWRRYRSHLTPLIRALGDSAGT